MSVFGGPDIVTDGLVLHWDIANKKSYPGDGSLKDISGYGRHATLTGTANFIDEFGGVVQFVASQASRYYNTTSFRETDYTIIGASRYYGTAKGRIISLFKNEPFVIFHKTGSSLEETKPEAFSAFTAKSSDNTPAAFLDATLLIVATSSIKYAISSRRAKKLEAILNDYYFNIIKIVII